MTLLDAPFVTSEDANANRPSTEFSVAIGPRDPLQLRRLSQEFADRAIGGATLEESMKAAAVLSYIRDPVAVESLVRVLQQGSWVEQYAVEGLGRIGSAEAIAALVAAQDHPDEDVRAAVRRTLQLLQGQAQGESGHKD
jgi:HEAT repeats